MEHGCDSLVWMQQYCSGEDNAHCTVIEKQAKISFIFWILVDFMRKKLWFMTAKYLSSNIQAEMDEKSAE